MSTRPRWSDDLSSDPFSNPAYTVSSGATGWTYNASTDRLENTTGGGVNANFTLLNSKNPTGIVETDLQYFYSTGSDNTAMGLRAFGYWLVTGEQSGSKAVFVLAEEGSPGGYVTDSLLAPSNINNEPIFLQMGRRLAGPFTIKVVGTPTNVFFYIDGVLEFTAPARLVATDINVHLFRSGGGSGGTIYCSRLDVKFDSSLPFAPVFTSPSLAGALPSSTGPLVVQIPESRLYLDLEGFSGRIGPDGLDNVVYDPGGANVSMSEDTGVLDGFTGNTLGDYYLEAPVRGVSSASRLVIKEAFVIANSVSPSDSIDFDIVGGPTGQTETVVEEDDLQCYVEKHSSGAESSAPLRALYPPVNSIALHNVNADGNDAFIIQGGARSRVLTAGGTGISNITRLKFDSTASLPFIFDIDLLKVRRLRKLFFVNIDPEGGVKDLSTCDLYSKTTPFSGASLGQGTLENNNYGPHVFRSVPGNTLDKEYWQGLLSGIPDIDIRTRYLRIVFNSDNLAGISSSGGFNLGRQIGFFEQSEFAEINSVDDNAQFEFDSGGGFGAFPGGGVPQSGGYVRITLTSDLQHDGTSPNYYKVFFKPDLTD